MQEYEFVQHHSIGVNAWLFLKYVDHLETSNSFHLPPVDPPPIESDSFSPLSFL
jgi:hypothetical protein